MNKEKRRCSTPLLEDYLESMDECIKGAYVLTQYDKKGWVSWNRYVKMLVFNLYDRDAFTKDQNSKIKKRIVITMKNCLMISV